MFSPRDFKAWVIKETNTGNNGGDLDSPAITASLLQLDVDAVEFPSISPNQVLDVRTGRGRVLNTNDVHQDNEFVATEISLSGTFHKDGGHLMLMQSVCGMALNPSVADITVGATATGKSGVYGAGDTDKTFTLVLASPDTTNGYNIVMVGCLCTSFTLNADISDGGVYKWSATISTGRNVITNNTQTEAGAVFASNITTLAGVTVTHVYNIATPIMNSFSLTMDFPAVYGGLSSGGFASFNRGAELSVTADTVLKYDSTTRPLLNTFNTQTAGISANALTLTQGTSTDGTITIPEAILTGASIDQSDLVMMNVSMKALSDASTAVMTIDFA